MMGNIEVLFVIEGCYDYGDTDVWRDWRDDGVLVSKDQVSVFVACYV